MRILIRRRKAAAVSVGSEQTSDLQSMKLEAEQYMRVVFASIEAKIKIDGVEFFPRTGGFMYSSTAIQDQIVVHYSVQPSVVASGGVENIGQAIRKVVALRDDLFLESFEVPRPRTQVPAIQEVGSITAGSHKYEVRRLFAWFLTTHPESCQEIGSSDVDAVKLIFVQDNFKQWNYTGEVSIEKGSVVSSPAKLLLNPYCCLAKLILDVNSESLRAAILSDDFRGLQITVCDDGKITFDIQKAQTPASESAADDVSPSFH